MEDEIALLEKYVNTKHSILEYTKLALQQAEQTASEDTTHVQSSAKARKTAPVADTVGTGTANGKQPAEATGDANNGVDYDDDQDSEQEDGDDDDDDDEDGSEEEEGDSSS